MEEKRKGYIKINRYVVLGLFVFFLLTVGATYAYYTYQVEDTVAIKGNIVSVNATLNVELVSGTNDEMVPLKDAALYNAINGNGGTSACVDSVGNLSCQVYKITLTNNGSRLQDLKGIIELYAKSGSTYTNLKWQELGSATTLKDGASSNGMSKTNLVSGLTLESKESQTWYIAVWISETDTDQRNTDTGDFGGTVTFYVANDMIKNYIAPNAQSDSSINFASISSDTNGKGVYLMSSTASDTHPIYYFRGAVTDNNVLFADFCWKIVRTTETGGVKLIYNGTPTDGTCDNTGTASQLATKKAFNSSYNSPAYVGYMYGTVYTWSSKSMSSVADTYYYGNSVTYTDGTYTLTDTITSSSWADIYNGGLNSNHYTCFSTGTTCSSVYYIYYTSSSTAYYITLADGKTVEDALSEMLDYNTTSSTIKGNNTTEGTLDYWYYTNIDQKGYGKYVEDTIWCNDRSIYDKAGWDPDGGSTTSYLYFSGYQRRSVTKQPSLTCTRDIDKFTVSTDNGNGDLDYPVGLLTSDEIMLAGGQNAANSTYYLYTGEYYWAGSPFLFSYSNAYEFYVGSNGNLSNLNVDNTNGVRPSVSLTPGTEIISGSGTVSDPYIVG